MFPGQQGATCPAQPRPRDQTSGGGAKYGKVRPRGLLSDGITKNRCSQPSFCTVGGKRQSGLISTLPPLYFRNHLTSERRAYFRLAGQLSQLIFAPKPCIFSHILPPYTAHQAPYAPRHSRQDAGQAVRGAAQPRRARAAPHPQRIGSGWYRVFCTLRRHRVELLKAVTTARRALVVI